MNIITLPNDLNLDGMATIQLFDYRSSREVARQQIALNQNTFSFLLEGTKEVVFEDALQSIDPAKFLLMKAGHCLMTEQLSKANSYRSVLLFFSNEMIYKFIQKYEVVQKKPNDYKTAYAFDYDAFIRRFVCSLLDIATLSKEIQQHLLAVKLDEILWYLVEINGKDMLYSLVYTTDDSVQKFTRIIESNQLRKSTLKELAFLCNMSESTFKRMFKKHYGESPMRWFQNKRLEQAHYLLTVEKKTASEIYLEVGYESLSSFVQAYRVKYGHTPKQHHKM
ncbi:helix-turn-helix transcriptional regulator [Myroides sp. NP-2]|uniref:helix-turn-helix domain-containing protein n=1 Tax=Myroides sp. NP-2 TaxID=2759945 RepID=UPI0015F9AAF4|nr:AraC family transcriptional regulator [Myroides sp. NP-2]MBB1150830.1 helix-turn-helix transcriptional regulator [Myroides sp. NP-2]